MPLVPVEEEELPARVRADDVVPAPEPAPQRSLTRVQTVLAMQRSLGNAAVVRMLQRNGTMDAMIAEARRREEASPEDDNGVDASEWDDEPDHEPLAEPEVEAAEEAEPESEEETQPEPQTQRAATESPMARPGLPVPAAGGILHSRQRAAATGQTEEDAVAEADANLASTDAWLPKRADPRSEIPTKAPWRARRQRKLEKTVGAHAKNIPGQGQIADSGAMAANALAGHQADEARWQKQRGDKAEARAEGQREKKRHQGQTNTHDTVEAFKKARAAEELKHNKLVERDHLEVAYGPERKRARALVQELAAASPFVLDEVKRHSQTVTEIAEAEPHNRLAQARQRVGDAEKAIKAAVDAEAAYASVREKAARILKDINSAGVAFKDRIAPKSLKDAERYATGSPVAAGKPQQEAHLALNAADQDVKKQEKDWEVAGRSRGKLATLKARRAVLGYIDAAANHVIAVADADDLKGDFWALQESVKDVDAAVVRLNGLETEFNRLTTRLNHVNLTLPGTVPVPDQATITNGVANRALAPDPVVALRQLHGLMKTIEVPTIAHRFHAPRLLGNYNAATAGLTLLVNNGVVRPGRMNSVYTTSYDGSGFSAEFLVDGIPEIVIHTHCTKEGVPKDGDNASHWKPASVKKLSGATHAIPDALRNQLVDRDAIIAAKDFDRSKG